MAKVTITIEDKFGDYLSVEFTPTLREISAKRLSGERSPALSYAQHIGEFLKLGIGEKKPKENKNQSRLITPGE